VSLLSPLSCLFNCFWLEPALLSAFSEDFGCLAFAGGLSNVGGLAATEKPPAMRLIFAQQRLGPLDLERPSLAANTPAIGAVDLR
jgi:hypothetical protein